MKELSRVIAFGALLIFWASGYADGNWTGEIGKITVFEDASAYVIISNPRNGPVATFDCTQNVVYLGVKNTPANHALLSQVMMAYSTSKTIRFGVRGTGASCESTYITAE